MLKKTLFLLLFALSYFGIAGAATTLDVKRETERAMSLLEHGRYSEALHSFTILRQDIPVGDDDLMRNIEYGLTRCAAELRDNNAEEIMLAFLRRYPESVHLKEIYFLLAMHYCEQENYVAAGKYLNMVSYHELNEANREKYDMRKGYIEFLEGDYKLAYDHFSRLAPNSKYADHATYYKSYIHYSRGEFKEAYEGFSSLKSSDNYAKIIPYYLLQIEFARGNYQYVVSEGDALLKRSTELERVELTRVIAEAWYRLEYYDKAYAYIKIYAKAGGEMGPEDNYILGFSAYRSADYNVAADALRKVAGGGDELAQNASYHLADCYLRLGDKKSAIQAFSIAVNDELNKEITEDALFNYGLLLFDTRDNKFDTCINVLTSYVKKYPNSERAKKAKELLIAAYCNKKDYDTAYEAIKSFPNPDAEQRAALQKIIYNRGLDAYTAGDYDKAQSLLLESQGIMKTTSCYVLSLFWLGEIAFKKGDYVTATKNYSQFRKNAPKNTYESKMALYNLGYARYMLSRDGDIDAAKTKELLKKSMKSFESFVEVHTEADTYRADAFNRLGDICYALRSYESAAKSYEKSVATGADGQDYAKYQRAMSHGLAGHKYVKIDYLKIMLNEDCGDYNDDAAYELGNTYLSLSRYSDGATALESFLEKYPNSSLRIPAYLNLGLAYLNLGDNEKSLAYYDKVIKESPMSPSAKDALLSVREIYVSEGRVNEYFEYAKNNGMDGDLTAVARDSLLFSAAQKMHLENRIPEAVTQLNNYIKECPNGFYITNALFLLCDCYVRTENTDEAIKSLKQLSELPKNEYTEDAFEKLAELTLEKKMYDDAAAAYRKLYDVAETSSGRAVASAGYVNSIMALEDDDKLLEVAKDLDSLTDVEFAVKRKVLLKKANILVARNKSKEALKIYGSLAIDITSAEGSEAAYRVIEAIYATGNYDEAEKKIFELADSNTTHTYWLGKAFILLGDIYVKRNDLFQARATYRSVVDGYTPADDGIVAEAQSKLDKLN